MSKRTILLTTFGSFGDIHPYMAIALGLKSRGHSAVLLTSEIYRKKIESAGIEFAPSRPDLQMPEDPKAAKAFYSKLMDHKTGTEFVIREMFLGKLAESHEDLYSTAVAIGADVIVAHALAYSAPLVSEQLSIPWIWTGLQPIIMFSAEDPSVPAEAPWLIHMRKFGAKFYRNLMKGGIKRFAQWSEPIYSLRRKLGLTTNVKDPVLGGHFSPYCNLALFSKHFAPMASDWPQNTVQTGFAFYDHHDVSQSSLSDETLNFLASGDPPIVFTLGTAAVRDARNFYADSLAAARKIGRRSILLTGHETGNNEGLKLGTDTLALDYAPFAEIFPKACAIVHQGGIGTTSQALRSGKPSLVMPYGHDQPDNALRCERLGVSKSLTRWNYSESSAATLLSKLLDDALISGRAEKLGSAIGAEHGVEEACDAIECSLEKGFEEISVTPCKN